MLHHDGHAEVWEAVASDCESVAVAHSRESLRERLIALGYTAPRAHVFGAEWTKDGARPAIVLHGRAYHRTPERCWVCEHIACMEHRHA